MTFPRITPKRWFWGMIVAGLVWSLVGTRWNVPWMAGAQQAVAAQPAELILTPGTFVFGSVQTAVSTAIRGKGVRDGHQGETNEALRERVRQLENDLAQSRAWNRELEGQVEGAHQLRQAGIPPENVLEANVLGRQSAAGTSTLTLDKGSMDGVPKDAAVLVALAGEGPTLQGVTLLGRVETVNAKQCTLRLLTDPASRVRVQIVRPQPAPGTNPLINSEPVLAYGLGSNEMAFDIRDMNVKAANPPVAGDLVQLIDNTFPRVAQYMVIGQIDSVRTRSDNALRYELHVTPRVAITSLHTVMILMK